MGLFDKDLAKSKLPIEGLMDSLKADCGNLFTQYCRLVSKHSYPIETTDYAANICYRNIVVKYKDEFKELNIIPVINIFRSVSSDTIDNKIILDLKAYEVDEGLAERYWDAEIKYISFYDQPFMFLSKNKIAFRIRCEQALNRLNI